MKVVYLCEPLDMSQRNGGTIRRNGLVSVLERAGSHVSIVELPRRRRRLGFVRPFARRDLRKIAASIEASDVVWIEGMPLHQAVRRASSKVRVYWDLCDSWPLKYMSDFRTTHSLPAIIKFVFAWCILLRMSRTSVGYVYISPRDAQFDRMLTGVPQSAQVIIRNGADVPIVDKGSKNAAVTFGDWTYEPNRRSYEWLAKLGDSRPSRVSLFGKGSELLPEVKGLSLEGYAASLYDILLTARLILAPAFDGAGVKNKVLEPAYAGIPVITTAEGASGLELPPWVYIAEDQCAFLARWREWMDKPPIVETKILHEFRRRYSWEVAVDSILTLDPWATESRR